MLVSASPRHRSSQRSDPALLIGPFVDSLISAQRDIANRGWVVARRINISECHTAGELPRQ